MVYSDRELQISSSKHHNSITSLNVRNKLLMSVYINDQCMSRRLVGSIYIYYGTTEYKLKTCYYDVIFLFCGLFSDTLIVSLMDILRLHWWLVHRVCLRNKIDKMQ